MIFKRSRGEMDITTVFGTVIEGSNPPESTRVFEWLRVMRLSALRGGFEKLLPYFWPFCGQKRESCTEHVMFESPREHKKASPLCSRESADALSRVIRGPIELSARASQSWY